MAGDWLSYDIAAESHDRLAVPSFFEQPARDLVARINLGSAARILDIGTGSGVAALRAAEGAGPHTTVVGIDPSLEMLRVARKNGLRFLAVASMPGLGGPPQSTSLSTRLGTFQLRVPGEKGLPIIAGIEWRKEIGSRGAGGTEVKAAFARTITANNRIEDALTASSIIPKVFGGPYLHHLEFQMSTENGPERRFVQVVKETFALHPLRVSIFEGQIGDAVWLKRPR